MMIFLSRWPGHILLATILLGLPLFSQPKSPESDFYQIRNQSSTGLEIDFTFQEPLLENNPAAKNDLRLISIPGLNLNYEPGLPLLPVAVLPLALPPGDAKVTLSVHEQKHYPGVYPALFQETAVGLAEAQTTSSSVQKNRQEQVFRGLYPESHWQLSNLGIFRDAELSALRIYPVRVTGSGITFLQSFTIKITFGNRNATAKSIAPREADILKKMVVNKGQTHLLADQSPAFQPQINKAGSTAQTAESWQILVDTTGFYKVTGLDLQNAGIDLDRIDVASLSLTNKGSEIAYYLVDGKDNTFDEADFIEFWGERNERTFIDQYSDQYNDPFSDQNVYWLTWGNSRTIRMIEENGSRTATQPGTFNPSFFYTWTVHVESDRHFDRLGQGSQEQLSYTRDLWYFDSGVKAIGKSQYPFQLIHPDETSFNPVIVTAMFSGKSFGQRFEGLPVAHNVMLWLNDGFVGNSSPNWFEQDTSRITNVDNSSLNNSNLRHGQNVLEVQLPTLPNITIGGFQTKGTDLVLLNWFDVTYDRLYKAHQNVINFRRPTFVPFPAVDKFEFELEDFERSDISIYKKNVSKIVNFDLEQIQTNEGIRYRATFQDNVPSADVEYIALTEDRKLKPAGIRRDSPPDANNPQRRLKDRSNRAEVVMITHERFSRVARDMAEYRRDQGYTVELINVQDIYDEFNYGIKSPLAIRDFLKYAFFNWDRAQRLKYVLLIGDSDFNYKTTSEINKDFVPTFFFQTQEFGASATDYPYALIAGEDEIPDLFVGRLPVSSNGDLTNILNKIKEYESPQTSGAWRTRGLFISGNDRVTYELRTILGRRHPAFRTQNSRVIESIFPNHFSASRLNTVADTSLSFDPNFGSSPDLLDAWDDGLFYINFMGHGGGGIWSDVNLMDLPDVDRLANKGKYPFVTSMTCFTGAFENPGDAGLAQKLLLAPERGAIAIYASSGLGYLHNDFSLLWYTGPFLFDRDLRLGEQLFLGKTLYWNNGARYNFNGTLYQTPEFFGVRREMVYQYNLIGDPLLKLQLVPDDLTVSVNNPTPARGEELQVTVNAGFTTTDGYIELSDNNFNVVESFPVSVSQNSDIRLTVPADFPEGVGLIRVYQTDGSQEASGSASIGVNYAALNDLTFDPAAPDVDDSVRVNILAEDASGIKQVYLFLENDPDTIKAIAQTGEEGRYIATLPPTFALKTVAFNLFVENLVGNVSAFRNLTYVVNDIRPDLTFTSGSMQFTGNKHRELEINLQNQAGAGETGEVAVDVYFYNGRQNLQQEQPFASARTTMGSVDSTTLRVPFADAGSASVFEFYARAEVAPNQGLTDFNPANDTTFAELELDVFELSPQTASDTIIVDNRYRIFFPAGSVSDSSAVRIRGEAFLAPRDQQGLQPVSLLAEEQYQLLNVRLLNPTAEITGDIPLQINFDESLIDTLEFDPANIRLYQKRSERTPWLFNQSEITQEPLRLTSMVNRTAKFAPFVTSDRQAPQLELTADGQPIDFSGLVSENPSLYLIIQDESGINLNRETIGIEINNQALPESQVFVPDSINSNNILGITLNPLLSQGRHQLSVTAEDVNGNLSRRQYELVVADGFDIRVYGNYPNPFTDETIFSYYVDLNDVLDEFEIRIYTVSGRLIRKIASDINNPPGALDGGAKRRGYNELIWDGKDRDGVEVANGVYLAVVYAKYQDEVIEKTLKVAKLR